MKFENLLLQTLFSACLLACLLVVGAMLTGHTPSATFAASPAATAATAPSAG